MSHPARPDPSSEFDALDLCHRQTLIALGRLRALVHRLESAGPDTEARSLAREVVAHFTGTVRPHHAEEERLVFPALVASGAEPDLVRHVLRLQQDHAWLEEDWMALEPQLEAIAHGLTGWDLDELRAGVEVFAALSMDHIALEESIVYPEARARLAVRNAQSPGRAMAQARRQGKASQPA